jgi:sugar phosphate isomerase/epimerase
VAAEPFRYCLNTSTIEGQKPGIVRKIEIAAQAGYNAVEPWVRELDRYVEEGGRLEDLAKRLRDLGLGVGGVIGFFEWVVDDDDRRRRGLEEARRNMDMVRAIGGDRIAAPPFGAADHTALDLLWAAERYRTLLELGDCMGVVPLVEFWGHSRCLNRLGEAALIAVESGHPRAGVLADVYHLYKGGSGFAGLRLLSGTSLPLLHFNDYPAEPPRADLTDAHRVYPGDGAAPLTEILRDLRGIGFRGLLSLELFNRTYWAEDPLLVARTGLDKMRTLAGAAAPR